MLFIDPDGRSIDYSGLETKQTGSNSYEVSGTVKITMKIVNLSDSKINLNQLKKDITQKGNSVFSSNSYNSLYTHLLPDGGGAIKKLE